jgi:hypothetical protein
VAIVETKFKFMTVPVNDASMETIHTFTGIQNVEPMQGSRPANALCKHRLSAHAQGELQKNILETIY